MQQIASHVRRLRRRQRRDEIARSNIRFLINDSRDGGGDCDRTLVGIVSQRRVLPIPATDGRSIFTSRTRQRDNEVELNLRYIRPGVDSKPDFRSGGKHESRLLSKRERKKKRERYESSALFIADYFTRRSFRTREGIMPKPRRDPPLPRDNRRPSLEKTLARSRVKRRRMCHARLVVVVVIDLLTLLNPLAPPPLPSPLSVRMSALRFCFRLPTSGTMRL